jgi:hypothetical protein
MENDPSNIGCTAICAVKAEVGVDGHTIEALEIGKEEEVRHSD